VFFKGCPLRCRWCANPENLAGGVEIGFIGNLCKCCGRCAETCRFGAIVPGEGRYRIDRQKCVNCGECVDTCYYDALVRYGKEMTSGEAFDAVRKDKMFYRKSGGGATVSGGEPLMYAAFIRELFEACRSDGISTCVETCGCVGRDALDAVLPVTDLFLFDLKHMDPETHKKYTGASNETILSNARYIVGQGANVQFRHPLIPGVNDNAGNIEATAAFIRGLGSAGWGLQLMPYHRMGQSKYQALGIPYETEGTPVMTPEEVDAVKDAYIAAGVECTISR